MWPDLYPSLLLSLSYSGTPLLLTSMKFTQMELVVDLIPGVGKNSDGAIVFLNKLSIWNLFECYNRTTISRGKRERPVLWLGYLHIQPNIKMWIELPTLNDSEPIGFAAARSRYLKHHDKWEIVKFSLWWECMCIISWVARARRMSKLSRTFSSRSGLRLGMTHSSWWLKS